ncbi:MAG: hypothetical protein QXJ72_05580 [Thermoproteota archaeon]
MEIQEFLEAKKKEFLEVLKKNSFNLEAPEVLRALEVIKAFEVPCPVVQTFIAPNGLEINLKLRYPSPYPFYNFKVGYWENGKPIIIPLKNTYAFKLL